MGLGGQEMKGCSLGQMRSALHSEQHVAIAAAQAHMSSSAASAPSGSHAGFLLLSLLAPLLTTPCSSRRPRR